ncbi:hypothetical protein ACJIZ3_004851 [Penstemon smallii]|uniref:Uncharacterized protein n=1 Tax=Penstemon smallii TaxID=265156 RepID=A0ABD3S390_9LAMI
MASTSRARGTTTSSILREALGGELIRFQQLATELDNGDGLAKAITNVKDDKGRSAIHFAAAGGRYSICYYLIEKIEIEIDMSDDNGDTPLHFAVLCQHVPVTRYLIRLGASSLLYNSKGYTPLHYAAEKGNEDILECLITNGAIIDHESETGTPLHWAAAKGNKEAVKLLLARNANPNSISHHFITPLLLAVISGSLECLVLLLKAGADPNIARSGVTPLGQAARNGFTAMVYHLLKHRADPNAVDTRMTWIRHSESKGKEALLKKEYAMAVYWYSQAMALNPHNETLYSDRSMTWARLNKGKQALSDAEFCVSLKPLWSKGHYRKGAALLMLKDYSMALEEFSAALKLEPKIKEAQQKIIHWHLFIVALLVST